MFRTSRFLETEKNFKYYDKPFTNLIPSSHSAMFGDLIFVTIKISCKLHIKYRKSKEIV